MKYPGNITGPHIDEGDLINFTFDNAELTFRSPRTPSNSDTINQTCSINSFCCIDTRQWDTNDQERPSIELLYQLWCFEDSKSLDDIAQCQVFAGLVEVPEQQQLDNTLLSPADFQNLMLAWHHHSVGDLHDEKYAQDPSWPALPNRYKGRAIAKEHLDWFVVELKITLQEKPVQLAMIPINNRFVLMTFIDLQSLHYAGRSNPYSNDTLKQFEKDLFEEFLSHINIQYSPVLIEKIQSLRTAIPA